MSIEIRRKQLKYQAWHRGTKECDLLLGKFSDVFISAYTTQQLDEFETVLSQQDVDLYHWITAQETPAHLNNNKVFQAILAFHS